MALHDYKPLNLNSLHLSDVNCFDIWDRRECAVANPALWHQACASYKNTPDFQAGIPHHLHQIWIGTRQPPCVWLDTWRLDFMHMFEKPAANDDAPWQYTLWDNQAVRAMRMLNRDLFDAESAPQCQADILRLEVLYEYGGVYVDADIVSTVKDLRPALESAKDTGFLITYEPDTKDKPYSILGNSLIACTPRHPLILMLMSYIRQVYPFKRPHYGVEWVTGPLTYTKVLVNTDMPITVPPSKDFYPAFHYVPNPSAIDVTQFDSYCFQFGYTCSGLSQWVAENNRCRRAHDCSYHSKILYPLGKLRQFPTTMPAVEGEIPKVMHQFYFGPDYAMPKRWSNTWSDVFCPCNDFTYELWTWDRLKNEIGSFFCANLYKHGRMDAFSVKMLALEVLHSRGGYYVPLTTLFTGSSSDAVAAGQVFGNGEGGFYQSGSILGYAQGTAIEKIKHSYDSGRVEFDGVPPACRLVADMAYGDEVAAFAEFKDTSRFLGAGEIYYVPQSLSNTAAVSTAHAALLWAYDCQVPIFRFADSLKAVKAISRSGHRSIVITDSQFGLYPDLVDEIPGVMYRLEQEGREWDFIVMNVEWEVDDDGLAVYQASTPVRAPTAHYLGFIASTGAAKTLQTVDIDRILERQASGKVFIASLKSRHSEKVASLFRAMPSISQAFRTLAGGFEPNFYRDHEEIVDNLFKGMRHGQIGFELQIDNQKRVMFRAWGDDGSINCECKLSPGMNGLFVESMRVYDGGSVTVDRQGEYVR